MSDLFSNLLSGLVNRPEFLSVTIGIIMFFVKSLLKDKYAKNEAIFAQAVDVAFNIVNDIAKVSKNKIDDKVALGLQALQEYLKTHGQNATEKQLERAKLLFSALNGMGK